MRLAYFLLLIVLHPYQGETQNISIEDIHSEVIVNYIKEYLPDYNFIGDSIASCSRPNIEAVYCCICDYNGDSINDYAIFLRDTINKVCLFSFSLENNRLKHYVIDCFGVWEGKITELRVAIEPSGTWEGINEKINVPFDGFIVDDLRESISKAYYWNGKNFIKFLYD